jgi:acetyl esterase/lipase
VRRALALALLVLLWPMPASAAVPVVLPPGATLSSPAYCNLPSGLLLMDIYRPAQPTTSVVLYIHGGSWQWGHRRYGKWLGALGAAFLERGIAFASIDYRLAPTWRWSAQHADAKCATRFLRNRLGYQRIGVVGESAGGHMAAMLATADPWLRPTAVVDLYGPTLLTDWEVGFELTHAANVFDRAQLSGASPANYATSDDPPILIATGTDDPITPPSQAWALGNRLSNSTVVIVQGAGHGLTGYDVVGLVTNYLAARL